MENTIFTLVEEKIHSYEKIIGELKARIAKDTEEDLARNEKILAELELKASEIKKTVLEYEEEGKEKWAVYNDKFNHDLDELGKVLETLTGKSL